jgi:long-chain acyl-CoA synthetase
MAADTISKLFKQSCDKYGDKKVAIRHKKFGIWQTYTWGHFWDQSKYLGLGLLSLGWAKGDRVTIVGDNEPEWYYSIFAAIGCGGIPTGAYQDSMADEIKFVINQSGSTMVIVEDQEQLDKILDVKEDIPQVKKIVYWDPKGLRLYDDPLIISWEKVLVLGREYEKSHPGLFEERIAQSQPEDPVYLTYSSGTTGVPKGILHCSRSTMASSMAWDMPDPTDEKDDFFSAFPLAYGAEFIYMIPAYLRGGATVNFPEEPETLEQNVREIGPTKGGAVPRVLENYVSFVQVKISDSTWLKRTVYNLLMPVGYAVARKKLKNRNINVGWKILYGLYYFFVARPIRDWIGYTGMKVLMIGGASMAAEVFDFFVALGLDSRMIYGMIECAPTAVHQAGDIDYETSGVPSAGCDIRITGEGEILTRGPMRMLGYFNNPEATAKLIDEQGWVHTSDAGFITDKGHVVCIDRIADLLKLKDGAGFSPSYIENKLKFSPYIRDAVITGDDQEFVGALISIDFPNLGKWAETRRIPYTTFVDLSQKKETYELIKKDILKINRKLPEKQRIRRFAILHKELDADDAELTRTRKLRRKEVSKRYQEMIEALYSDKHEYHAEAKVKYRDGKTATIETAVQIATLEDK